MTPQERHEKNKRHIQKLAKLTGIPYVQLSEEEEVENRRDTIENGKRMMEEEYQESIQRSKPVRKRVVWDHEKESSPKPDFVTGSCINPYLQPASLGERSHSNQQSNDPLPTISSPSSKEQLINFNEFLELNEQAKVLNKSKKVSKERQAFNKKMEYISSERRQQYRDAYLYLEKFLKPRFAMRIYDRFGDDVEALVDYVTELLDSFDTYTEMFHKKKTLKPGELAKVMERQRKKMQEDELKVDVGMDMEGYYVDDLPEIRQLQWIDCDPRKGKVPDIPEFLKDTFKKYCKKHPVKEFRKKAKKYPVGPRGLRVCTFLQKWNEKTQKKRFKLLKERPLLEYKLRSPTGEDAEILADYQVKRYRKARKLQRRYLEEAVAMEWIPAYEAVEDDPDYQGRGTQTDEEIQRIRKYYEDLHHDKARCEEIRNRYFKRYLKKEEKQKRKAQRRWLKENGYGNVDDKRPFRLVTTVDGIMPYPNFA